MELIVANYVFLQNITTLKVTSDIYSAVLGSLAEISDFVIEQETLECTISFVPCGA